MSHSTVEKYQELAQKATGKRSTACSGLTFLETKSVPPENLLPLGKRWRDQERVVPSPGRTKTYASLLMKVCMHELDVT
jgi:hypothetical protein